MARIEIGGFNLVGVEHEEDRGVVRLFLAQKQPGQAFADETIVLIRLDYREAQELAREIRALFEKPGGSGPISPPTDVN